MTLQRRFKRILTIVLGVGLGLGISLVSAVPASAQDFVKVDDAAREQLPATPFIGVAYGFIWVAILLYVLSVARRLGRVQGEIQDLRRRLDRASTGAPPRG